jgi:hypothetical protein
MRTKTLLAVAALAAAGITGAMAQGSNVYSQNIVGYANIRISPGNGFYSNPFNHPTNNSASNIFTLAPLDDGGANPGGLMNNFYVLTFTGAGFDQTYYENDFTVNNVGAGYAGWAADGTPSAPKAPPTLNPGTGFIINNTGPNYTNTFLGDVVPNPGSTNTKSIGPGNQLIGSPTPFVTNSAGQAYGVNASIPSPIAALDDNAANPNNYFNNFYILRWTGSGFTQVYYENDFTVNNVGAGYAGWAVDGTPSAPASPPDIRIGEGYYFNNTGPSNVWIQYYTNAP